MDRVSIEGTEEGAALNLPNFEQRQSLRHQVAHALRAALIAGEMRPGVLYSAPTLAAKFGVSATPVREAMLDLASEGLVEAVRNKGFRVTELSDGDLDQITDLRMLIEVPTVGEIAERCEGVLAERVEALRSIALELEELAERADLIAYLEADRRFHLGLLAVSGNAHLVHVVGNLRARSRLYGLHSLAERGELVASAREHQQILDLVLDRDADGAVALMRQHIAHVRGDWARDRV
jgi:DNA-binding GntR family transcriptional regulator